MKVLQSVKDNGDITVLMQNYLYFPQILGYAKSAE